VRIKHHDSKPLFAAETAENLRLCVFVFLSVVAMTLDHRHHHLDTLRSTLATLLFPIQYSIQLPFQAAHRLSLSLSSHADLLEENLRLQQKQAFMNARIQKLAALEAENRRLRNLLESSANITERVVIAELMKVDFDPYKHRILLNKGTINGVHAGQPLIDQQGIVGQIIHASAFTATAILITDPNHALPVQINRNGLRTLAVGTGNFSELELPHIPNNDDVQVGDLLITSGLGGRFPRGYPVARVSRVEFDPGRPFARITAEPVTQLDRRREMLLIIDEPPSSSHPSLAADLSPP